MKLVPIFYFPLKILFIDDDVELLKAYHHLNLPNLISTESDPINAITLVRENHIDYISIFNEVTDNNYVSSLINDSDATVSFTFDNIKKLINDQNKHEKYGILVIDYKMPTMDGIQLCKQLYDLKVIKILLTGEYNPLDSISSLNNKTIDCFLPKGKADITTELIESIKYYQLEYFTEITSTFLNITANKFGFLADKDFIKIFNNVIRERDITSYYLMNNTGCFLLYSNQDKYILNIYSENDLNTYCDMYSHLPPEYINKVIKRQLIPNFELPENLNDLDGYFYVTNTDGNYYYSIIKRE